MTTADLKQQKLLIFLSHASQDKAPVRELCEKLKADGFDPWLDEERLLPGMNWDMEIEKALRASDAILLCFSELSVHKEGYIQREYKRAIRYQEEKPDGTIFVIPVRLDKCELPYFIKEFQFVDFPDGYHRLVVSLNLRSGKLASAPPIPAKKVPQGPSPAPGDSSESRNVQGTNVSGGISIQGARVNVDGDIFVGDKTVYGGESKKMDPIGDRFEKVYRQIDTLPDNPDVDKNYLKIFVKDVEKEVNKGDKFNENKLKNSLKLLAQSSEAVHLSVTRILQSPDLDIANGIQELAG